LYILKAALTAVSSTDRVGHMRESRS
jgi:hypothetical protein